MGPEAIRTPRRELYPNNTFSYWIVSVSGSEWDTPADVPTTMMVVPGAVWLLEELPQPTAASVSASSIRTETAPTTRLAFPFLLKPPATSPIIPSPSKEPDAI